MESVPKNVVSDLSKLVCTKNSTSELQTPYDNKKVFCISVEVLSLLHDAA